MLCVCVGDVMDVVFFCLYCEAWNCRCSSMGSVSVSSCRCCMFVSCVHPVAVLNAAFCMTCSLLMLVEDAIGDHTEEAYSNYLIWFQRQQPTSGGTVIPPNRFFDGFPDPSQFAAAKLTHYSSKPQRPSDSSRSWQRILLSGDVHPNPGPTTKYPCPVCARNVVVG